MRILFFSDIHGITNNLNKIEEIIENGNFDRIVCLGDICHTPANPSTIDKVNPEEVVAFLKKHKAIVVQGNCDDESLVQTFHMQGVINIQADGKNLYCTHGHLYSKAKGSKLKGVGVLVYGHEHKPFVSYDGMMTYVCVGSISLPRSNEGPTYAIFEDQKINIYNLKGEIIEEAYL